MFEKSKDLIGIIRLNGEMLKINPAFYELLGFEKNEDLVHNMHNVNLTDFVHPDFIDNAKASMERLKSGLAEVNYTVPLITKRNETKWIDWTSTPEPSTELVYFIGRDITAEHEQRILLKENEVRYRALFENSQSLMCTHDMEGNFYTINQFGADMLGCSVEVASSMNLKDLYPKEKHATINTQLKNLHKSRIISHVSEVIIVNGEKRNWLINSVIARNNKGVDYVIGNAVDLTDRLKMEKDLKVATKKAEEANRAKSEFIANMSHEIRTPLNGIIGFTDLVLKSKIDETQEQYLKIINQSGTTLLNIVDQVLDFSKIESRKLTLVKEKIDLQSLASDACTMVSFASEKKGLEMLLDFQKDLPRFIWADEIRLKQVLVNLLSNAVKFTEKGEVRLLIQLKEKLPNKHIILHFRVCDTGVGIHPDKLDKIFKAFTQEDNSITKKYGGTGLGLTISNNLLELMDSRLMVRSELQKGSCFSFDLTLKAEHDKFDDELLKGIKRILVVDDNDSNRQILKGMLQLKNIEVDEAKSGIEALLMLQKNAEYDVIIMDYRMPVIDGLETIRKIKSDIIKNKKPEEQPIVMLYSSSDSDKLQDECDKLDIHARLVKPIKMQELYEVLAQFTSKKLKEPVQEKNSTSDDQKCIFEKGPNIILIAEDNDVNMYLTKILVQQLSPTTQIVEARDGEEAVALFFEKNPDFVLMDIQMPKMNGLEATRQIRLKEKGSPTPIVALTAGNMSGERERSLKAGMNDFMAKPIVKKDLGLMLKKWINLEEKSEEIEEAFEPPKIEHLNKKWFYQFATDNIEYKGKFIQLARTGIKECAKSLQKGILNKDLEFLKATGHKLKGTCLAVGLTQLSKLAVAFELLDEYEEEYINKLFESVLFEIRIVDKLLMNEY